MNFTAQDIQDHIKDNNLYLITPKMVLDALKSRESPIKEVIDVLVNNLDVPYIIELSNNTLWHPRNESYNKTYYMLKDLGYPTWKAFSGCSDCSSIIEVYLSAIHNVDYVKNVDSDLWSRIQDRVNRDNRNYKIKSIC